MSDIDATNPVDGGGSPAPDTEVDNDHLNTAPEQQFDDDGNPVEAERRDDDTEEVE